MDKRGASLVKFGIWHNQRPGLRYPPPSPSPVPVGSRRSLRSDRLGIGSLGIGRPPIFARTRVRESEFRRSALSNVKWCWTRTSLYASLPLPVLSLFRFHSSTVARSESARLRFNPLTYRDVLSLRVRFKVTKSFFLCLSLFLSVDPMPGTYYE